MLSFGMLYDISLRRKVLERVKEGMSKREASRLFKVSPNTIYEWLKRGDDLSPRPAKTRKRKIDRTALEAHVTKYPDLFLRERAAHFKVDPSTISYRGIATRYCKRAKTSLPSFTSSLPSSGCAKCQHPLSFSKK